jgi:ABC-type lipoprotein release transport system permease subunit
LAPKLNNPAETCSDSKVLNRSHGKSQTFQMKFAWIVSRRYLRLSHKSPVPRLVTIFSVIGVAAGVGTLVVALAMNAGFRQTIQGRLLGVSAHVNLTRPGTEGIKDSCRSNSPDRLSVDDFARRCL